METDCSLGFICISGVYKRGSFFERWPLFFMLAGASRRYVALVCLSIAGVLRRISSWFQCFGYFKSRCAEAGPIDRVSFTEKHTRRATN